MSKKEDLDRQIDDAATQMVREAMKWEMSAMPGTEIVGLDSMLPRSKATCDHMTLRKPNQPCPHPECWRLPIFSEQIPQAPAHHCPGVVSPYDIAMQVRDWHRGEICMSDGTRFFAWRERP